MALAQRLRSLQRLSSGFRDVSAALGMLPQIVPAALEQSALMRLPSLSRTVDYHQPWHSPARCCHQPHCRRHALHILSFGSQSDANFLDGRHFSSGSAAEDKQDDLGTTGSLGPVASQKLSYEGPFGVVLTRLKRLSLFSCLLTFTLSPVIIWTQSVGTLGAKASIALMLCTFSCFTTGLLHWFTSPYVHHIEYDAASDTVTVETLSILAQKQRTQFTPKHAAYPETFRPQSTFALNGKVFYIDPITFPDQTLLERLTPPDPAAPTQPPEAGKDVTT